MIQICNIFSSWCQSYLSADRKLRGPICKSNDNGADKPTKIKKKDKKLKKDFKREEVLEKEEEGDPIGELYPRPSWEGIKRSVRCRPSSFPSHSSYLWLP
jgi:hypothetical protein